MFETTPIIIIKKTTGALNTVLPGHADVAHAVSQVAVTGEALLDGPLRFLTAALSPDRQRAPAGCGEPPVGWVLRFNGFDQLSEKI